VPYFGNEPAKSAIKVGDNTVLSATIANGVIINEDIKSDAAIAMSKTSLVAGTGITLATNTLNVDAAQTQITSVGTIGTGVWNASVIASAKLDADTAHLSEAQTFSGAKTFSALSTHNSNIYIKGGGTLRLYQTGDANWGNLLFDSTNGFNFGDKVRIGGALTGTSSATFSGALTVGVDNTGHDVQFFGATSGRYMLWDESNDSLNLRDSVYLQLGNSNDLNIYHDGSHNYIFASTANQDIIFKGNNGSNFTALTLDMSAGGSAIFGINQNSDSTMFLNNTNNGNAAQATMYITNSGSSADALFLGMNGTGITTAGGFVADGAVIGSGSGASNGLAIMSRHSSGGIKFYTGGHTSNVMTIHSSGRLETSTGSAISYDSNGSVSSPTATYLLARHDTEYSVVPTSGNQNFRKMKSIQVSKSGKLRIKFTAKNASGSQYWRWIISKNNSGDNAIPTAMTLTDGNTAAGAFSAGLANGVSNSVHTYRDYDVSVKDVTAGDTIELWMAIGNSSGGAVNNTGQIVYVKEFMIYSTTRSLEEHSMRNNIKQIVERNNNTGFNSSSSSYVYTGMYATITPKSKGSINQIWVSFPLWQSGTVAYTHIKLVADYSDGTADAVVYEQKDHYQGVTSSICWNTAFQVQHDHNKTTAITYKIYVNPNGTSVWAPNDASNNTANKGMITIWEVETE